MTTRRDFLRHSALLALSPKPVASQVLGARAVPRLLDVRPARFEGALRNPLMGFLKGLQPPDELSRFDWVSLVRHPIRWNQIEDDASDGMDKIRAFCDANWRGLDAANVKVIPRVHLRWSAESETYWPRDLAPNDYSSPKFVARLLRLIERLGEAWDSDARVAFVQMGLIGRWGEQHTPSISPSLQKLMGDAFTRAFPNKRVMVRYPWDFGAYAFGIYWDSWAHADESVTHIPAFARLGPRWKSAPMGGETAYDWGRFREQPGENPNATLSQEVHRKYLLSSVRSLHCNHLGWVADYDAQIPEARDGAEIIQRAFGYRFEIVGAKFQAQLVANQDFPFEISVRNLGSTPLYADWPLRLSLLDERTRREIWSSGVRGARTSTWMPGDAWDAAAQKYAVAPQIYTTRANMSLGAVPRGQYLLAVSVLDPASNSPALKLATSQYWRGGWHLLARVGVGMAPADAGLRGVAFDEPNEDRALGYSVSVRARGAEGNL